VIIIVIALTNNNYFDLFNKKFRTGCTIYFKKHKALLFNTPKKFSNKNSSKSFIRLEINIKIRGVNNRSPEIVGKIHYAIKNSVWIEQ